MHAARRSLALALTLAVLAWASSASAKDLTGNFGLGLHQSLGGVKGGIAGGFTGATLRYWPASGFGLELTAGANVLNLQGEGRTGLASTLNGAFGVVYNFARSLHANLGVGGRLALGYRSEELSGSTERTDASVQLNLEVPLSLEFFLSDRFSLTASTGLTVVILSPERGALLAEDPGGTPSGGSEVGPGSVAINGTVGAIYYF